jgi:hypothetical protein
MVTAQAQYRPGVLVKVIGGRLDLRYGFLDVIGVAGNVPGIGNLDGFEGLGVVLWMEIGAQVARRLANGLRPEACPRAVAGAGIERYTEDGDIAVGHVA